MVGMLKLMLKLNMNSTETSEILTSIKEDGVSNIVVGLANVIKGLSDKIDLLQKDNQDLRDIISRMKNSRLNDQVYAEVQRIIIDNRTEIIEPNENDVWNINRRLDKLQHQILDMQTKI